MTEPEPAPIETGPEVTGYPSGDPRSLSNLRREFYITNGTIGGRKHARELADEAIRKEQSTHYEGDKRRIDPRSWRERISKFAHNKKFHVLEEYYRQIWTESAFKAMVENNNSFLSMDFARGAADDANKERDNYLKEGQAKIGELKSESEERGAAQAKVFEVDGELKEALIAQILQPVINGTITSEQEIQTKLQEFFANNQGNDTVRQLFGAEANQYGEAAKLFATDLLDMGRLVAQDIAAHKYSIDQLGENIAIKLANPQWARQTEMAESRVDRAAAFGRRNKGTAWIMNPAALGAITALGTTALFRLPRTALRTMMAAPIAGSFVGAAYAGLRRWREVKIDRAMHMGELAYGRTSPVDAKRRQRMDELSYSMTSVNELIDGGNRDEVRGKDREGLQTLINRLTSNPSDTELRQDILSRVAEIRTRLDRSTADKVDLIKFSSRETVEQERFELVKNIAAAKVALRRAGMSDADITTISGTFERDWLDRITTDQSSKDSAFSRFRLQQSVVATGQGAITGMVSGLVVQELGELGLMRHLRVSSATALEHIPGVRGVLEKLSELGGPFDNLPPVEHSKAEFIEGFKNGGHMTLGNVGGIEYEAIIDPHTHSVELYDATAGTFVSGDLPEMSIGPDGIMAIQGHMDPDIQAALEQAGFHINSIDTSDFAKFPPLHEMILKDTDTFHEVTIGGHPITIPDGTSLIADPTDASKWDLVLDSDHGHLLMEHIHFDPSTGAMEPDFVYGPGVDHTLLTVTEGGTHLATHDEALQFWDKAHSQIDRREWYAYDQAGSQSNELRGYTHKQGDTLILDMSKMGVGYQKGLNPNPINVQEIIRQGQAGFAFSLPGMTDKPIWIPDSADGVADGLLHLDPHSTAQVQLPDGTRTTLGELSRMLVDQEALSQYDDGNIATELYGRRDVFRLGVDDKHGFWEAGWYTEQEGQNVLKVFATGLGTGDLGGEIGGDPVIELCDDITKEIPQILYDAIPTGGEPIPIIPIPMAGRRPLEAMTPGERRRRRDMIYYSGYYGDAGRFGTEGVQARRLNLSSNPRLNDLLIPLVGGYPNANYTRHDVRLTEREDSEGDRHILKDIREADDVYFALPHHIGDALITLGYVNAFIGKVRKHNPEAIVHIFVPGAIYDSLLPLEDQKLKIVNGQQVEPRNDPTRPGITGEYQLNASEKILSEIDQLEPGKKAVVLDFENHVVSGTEIIRGDLPEKKLTFVAGLFSPTFAYANGSDGRNRYRNFATELVGDVDNGERVESVKIPLPANAEDLYSDLVSRFGIETDPSKKQICLILEAGSAGRQYSVDQWVQAAALIQRADPDTQFNFMINTNKSADDPTLVDQTRLQDAITAAGLSSARMISGSMPEMIALFNKQRLIISDDGGMLHVAAATEGGPKVIGLFFPGFSNHWVMDLDRVEAISAPDGMGPWEEQWGEADESRKWINKIPPDQIARRALASMA